MTSNPHRFRKATTGRGYAVTVAETDAALGTVDRISPDHVRAAKWRATTPAGETVGGNHYSRDAAAYALADARAERVTARAAAIAAELPADPAAPLTLDPTAVADRMAAHGYRVIVEPVGTPPAAVRVTVQPDAGRIGSADDVARLVAARLLQDGYDVARSGATVTATRPEPDELTTYRSTGGGAYELAEPGTWQDAVTRAKAADAAHLRADHERTAELAAMVEHAETIAAAPAVLGRRTLAERAAAARTSEDTARATAAARLAEERAKAQADRLRPLLDRYAAAVAEWQAANVAQENAPSYPDAARYSERLEELAHELAAAAADLVPDWSPRVVVELVTTYACGHDHHDRQTVEEPAEGETVTEWAERVVAPLTGDPDHEEGSREHALYEAVVTGAPGRIDLVGYRYESEG